MVSLSYRTVMWLIPDALFLIMVIVANVAIVLAFVQTNVVVDAAEASIIDQRLRFSPNGYAKQDDVTGRTYPGTVSIIKLEEGFEESVVFAKPVMSGKAVALVEDFPFDPGYFNEKKYDEWRVHAIASQVVRGKGFTTFTTSSGVVVETFPGRLDNVVLMPR